jgi:hypothetical protein
MKENKMKTNIIPRNSTPKLTGASISRNNLEVKA